MTKKDIKRLPKYVMMGNVALRLVLTDNLFEYWRDGGAWGIKCKWIDDELYSVNQYGHDMKYLGGNKLIECTYDEWKENNGEYAQDIKDQFKNDYILLVEERINEYKKLLNTTKQGLDYYKLNQNIVEVLEELLSDFNNIQNNETNDDIPF